MCLLPEVLILLALLRDPAVATGARSVGLPAAVRLGALQIAAGNRRDVTSGAELSCSEDEGWPVMAPSHALPSDRLVGATRAYCPSTNDSPQGCAKGESWLLLDVCGHQWKKFDTGLANGPEQVQNSVHS